MPWSSIVRKATLDMKYLAAVEALPEETPANALAAEYLMAMAALTGASQAAIADVGRQSTAAAAAGS